MTLGEYIDEYDGLTTERKMQGVKNFLNLLIKDPSQYDDYIFDIMITAATIEQNDYFGTEGANI